MFDGIVIGLAGAEASGVGHLVDGGVGMVFVPGFGVGQSAVGDVDEEAAEFFQGLRCVCAVGLAPVGEGGERQVGVQVRAAFFYFGADGVEDMFDVLHTSWNCVCKVRKDSVCGCKGS